MHAHIHAHASARIHAQKHVFMYVCTHSLTHTRVRIHRQSQGTGSAADCFTMAEIDAAKEVKFSESTGKSSGGEYYVKFEKNIPLETRTNAEEIRELLTTGVRDIMRMEEGTVAPGWRIRGSMSHLTKLVTCFDLTKMQHNLLFELETKGRGGSVGVGSGTNMSWVRHQVDKHSSYLTYRIRLGQVRPLYNTT